MNKKDILKEMGNISPEFIEEANIPVRRKAPVLKLVAAAACFALVCACVAVPLSKGWTEDTPMVETGISTAPTGETKPTGLSDRQYSDESGFHSDVKIDPNVRIDPAETMFVKKWNEMPDNERYGTIEDAAYNRYFVTHSGIDSRYVGEPLVDTTARGYDIYEEKYHQTKVSLNCIVNVDKDAAICVKYEDSEGYYIFTNTNRTYQTLGEFSDAFGLSHYLTLAGDATLWEYNKDSIKYVESVRLRRFALTDEDAMLRLLLESREAAAVNYTDYLRSGARSYVNFSVNCLSTGQKNVSLTVYAEGYLVTNVGETGKCFFIGTEQAKKILDYIVANAEEQPWEPAYPPASTVVSFPEKTIPSYNPTEKTTPPYTSVDTTPVIIRESTRIDWETEVPTYTTGFDKPETTRIVSTEVMEETTCAYTRIPMETKPVYTGGTVIQPETTPRFPPSSEDYPVFTETTCETAIEYTYTFPQ